MTILDWVQIGRFAAGVDPLTNDCEIARADCAPRPCGDGDVSIADWVQAGRYAALVDAFTRVADCPTGGGLIPASLAGQPGPLIVPASTLRTLTVSNLVIEHGQTNWLQVLFDAQGNENALGFSLKFDTNLLTFVSARVGSNAVSAQGSTAYLILNSNPTNIAVGINMALPSTEAFAPGLQVVAEVCFRAAPGTRPVSTPVTFADKPLRRAVISTEVTSLPANHQGGTVVLANGVASAFEGTSMMEGGSLKLRLVGTPGDVWEVQGSSNLVQWHRIADVTNITGVVEYNHATGTNSPHRFYRAVRP